MSIAFAAMLVVWFATFCYLLLTRHKARNWERQAHSAEDRAKFARESLESVYKLQLALVRIQRQQEAFFAPHMDIDRKEEFRAGSGSLVLNRGMHLLGEDFTDVQRSSLLPIHIEDAKDLRAHLMRIKDSRPAGTPYNQETLRLVKKLDELIGGGK